MRSTRFLPLCALLVGCAHGGDAPGDLAELRDLAIVPNSNVAPLTDPQSGQIALSFSSGEVMTAQAVSAHLSDPNVMAFSQQLLSVHKQADADLKAIFDREQLGAVPSGVSTALDQMMTDTAASLDGQAVDQAYLAAQVKMHSDALVLIDCVLTPAMGNITLQSFVVGPLRSHVQLDLEAALTLSGAPAATTDGGVLDCSALCSSPTMLDDSLRAAACAHP